jgi:isopenicillin N synthase-like dioxygenase
MLVRRLAAPRSSLSDNLTQILGLIECMTDTIPIIDVADALAGIHGGIESAANQVRSALTTVGFFIMTGHGLPRAQIDRSFAAVAQLHRLRMERKMALKMNAHNNGYMTMGRYAVWTSDVNNNDQPDLNEAFFIRKERPADDPVYMSGRRFLGPNQWPEEDDLPGFRDEVLKYMHSLETLSHRLLPIAAMALDLESDWFDTAFDDSYYILRMSHYPPVKAEANQFGIAPHTDANFLTYLPLTEVPGLQVRMPDGSWQDVPYVPGAFAVNSGDIVKRWSNGLFKSTPHRALPPTDRDRYALPFFFGPSWDAMIECLPTCCGPDNPPQWPATTYGEWMTSWYDANYDHKAQNFAVA